MKKIAKLIRDIEHDVYEFQKLKAGTIVYVQLNNDNNQYQMYERSDHIAILLENVEEGVDFDFVFDNVSNDCINT